jgi:hypothetical protein
MQLKTQASGTWKRAWEGDADLRRFFPTAQWLMLAIAPPAVAQDLVADRAAAAAKEPRR